MTVPFLPGGVSNTQLRGATREVAAGLRYARSGAVATRRETRLLLDLEQRTFRIDRDPRVHELPKQLELSCSPRSAISSMRRAGQSASSGRRLQRRPDHARGGRTQIRGGR